MKDTKIASLSQEDVLKLLEEPMPEVRAEVAHKLASAYEEGGFSSTEVKLAEQIFRFLMHDAELRVRKVLADQIKNMDTIPHDIVLGFVQDIDEIALPMLQESSVLTDEDLVEIIEHSKQVTHQVAITKRKTISTTVSDALVDTQNQNVVSSLLQNSNAQISNDSVEKIANNHADNQGIADALVQRSGVPVAVIERLMTKVSDRLKKELEKCLNKATKNNELDHGEISAAVQQSRELATLNLLQMNPTIHEIRDLVGHLQKTGRLSSSIVITSLCLGYIRFFEEAMAKLCNIPPHNASTLVRDRGGLGFKSLYKKAGLPDGMYEAVFAVLGAVLDVEESGAENELRAKNQYHNRVIEKLLMLLEERGEIEHLSYLITLIQQNAKR